MEQRDSSHVDVKVILPNADALAHAIATANRFSQAAGLKRREQARLCIVVEELVANLMDHGDLPPQHASELFLSAETQDAVRIVVCDSGTSFDLRVAEVATPNMTRGGGAGLAVVRAWTTIVSYQSIGGRNRLELLLGLAST